MTASFFHGFMKYSPHNWVESSPTLTYNRKHPGALFFHCSCCFVAVAATLRITELVGREILRPYPKACFGMRSGLSSNFGQCSAECNESMIQRNRKPCNPPEMRKPFRILSKQSLKNFPPCNTQHWRVAEYGPTKLRSLQNGCNFSLPKQKLPSITNLTLGSSENHRLKSADFW